MRSCRVSGMIPIICCSAGCCAACRRGFGRNFMTTAQACIMGTIIAYLCFVILTGVMIGRRSKKSAEGFYLGGRGIGPLVTATFPISSRTLASAAMTRTSIGNSSSRRSPSFQTRFT